MNAIFVVSEKWQVCKAVGLLYDRWQLLWLEMNFILNCNF